MKFKILNNQLSFTILLMVLLLSIHFTDAKQKNSGGLIQSQKNYEVNMTLINELNEGGGAKDIEIVGNIGYVLSNLGLNVYNVSDPTNALELGHYYSDGYLGHSIAVYNNYVFTAADDRGLKIINITDPSNPELANTYTSTRPAAVYIQNNLLFLANWEHDFEIYNISDTPLITELITFKGEGYHYVYATDDLGFGFANNGSLVTVDISNPENIELIGKIDDEEILCIAIDGNFWYTGGPTGIKVFNSTNLSKPVLVSHVTETETTSISNMVILDDFLYASDFHLGFRIFDISDSITPSEIGRNDVGGSPLGFQVVGDIGYVASQVRGIEIIQIQIEEVANTTSSIKRITSSSESMISVSTSSNNKKAYFEMKFVLLGILFVTLYFKRSSKRN
ncbi:MAG: LVIVD repeat-containing protein [Candidatus Thorarchaeota archaeon]